MRVIFRTSDGSAVGDKHFEAKEGELVFDDNQTECVHVQFFKGCNGALQLGDI